MRNSQRWMSLVARPFARLPEWLKAVLIMWTFLSILVVAIPPLHDNLPRWFALAIVLPYAAILFLILIPVMFLDLLRVLIWPVRKAASLLRKAH